MASKFGEVAAAFADDAAAALLGVVAEVVAAEEVAAVPGVALVAGCDRAKFGAELVAVFPAGVLVVPEVGVILGSLPPGPTEPGPPKGGGPEVVPPVAPSLVASFSFFFFT